MFDIKTLELDKIINKAKTYAISKDAKGLFDNIEIRCDKEIIESMQNETFEALTMYRLFDDLRDSLPDNIKEVLSRIRVEAFLSINDFLELISFIKCANSYKGYQDNIITNKEELKYLGYYFDNIKDHKKISYDINQIINEDGEIYDNASLTLYDIRKKIRLQESSLRTKINEILIKKSRMLNESLIVYKDSKMCLPVKAEFKNTFPGIIHDESASGQTIYIEPIESVEISNKLITLHDEEKAEIEKILMALSVKCWDYYDEFKESYDNILKLDFIYAKAKYAKSINATKIKVNTNGIIELFKARHPLILESKCVPLNIKLGKDFKGIIITGPNTGGKTVSLKTVGLTCLMVQSGFLVPHDGDSTVNIFTSIRADIGDEQSIEQSLSSFSAHMTKVINIIDNIDNNSLVLFDELGSGTDPKEGSNLAISIIEYLIKKNARLIVTTHYTDLKVFAYNHDNLINASVEFNPETLMPTYKLLLGIPGQSNALTIAKRLGLNDEIIEGATNLGNQVETDTTALMKKLDDENQRLQLSLNEYENLVIEAKEKIADLNARENDLTKRYLSFEKDAKAKADKIINKAKEDAKNLIQEIEDLRKDENVKGHQIADLKHQIKELGDKDEAIETNYEFKVGDLVFIKSYEQIGKITRIKGEIYEVLMGNFTLKFKKQELAPHFEEIKPKKKVIYNGIKNVGGVAEIKQKHIELDLRGFRYEEVKPELERFIEDSYNSKLTTVYVIHGFGTGAVRKACYEYFKKCPYVVSTRFGGEGEGLNGVTVVTLK